MRERARTDDLARALTTWTPGEPPAVDWFLPELRDLLRAELMGAYRPARTSTGWSLDFMRLVGDNAPAKVHAFERYVARLPDGDRFLDYSPQAVPPDERNRALSLEDIAGARGMKPAKLPYGPLFHALGIGGHDQLRVLVSSGPTLLGWIGATRASPFTKRETTVLRRLAAPLRERLAIEQRLRMPGLRAAALDVALEALGRPAFVVGPNDGIEIANRAGRALLDTDRARVLAAIRDSESSAGGGGAFTVTRLTMPGCPAYRLAIETERACTLVDRVALAARAWSLTARQIRVLELVATGATNKEIAARCACAEVTVESHLTELFRRSGARCRAELVGRLFHLARA